MSDFIASLDGETQPIPLLQDKPRDYPLGGDVVRPVSVVTSECRESSARAWHRREP
jgi:hypothetical protein